jgi:hypothetical protein
VESKDINLRSDEVNEIFAKMPSHMVLWGNTWILAVLIGLLALAYVVKYPDVITGTIILTSNSAPVVIVPVTNGKISLLRENFSNLNSGERIAYINEDTRLENMDSLFHFLKTNEVEAMNADSISDYALGILQSSWSRFIVDLQGFQVYKNMHPELVGIASSSRQIKHNQKSVQSLQEQIKLKESQLQFYKRKLEKDKSLLDQGMIPEREFQNTQMQYSDMQNQLKSLSSQQISIDKNNADYQKQIADYQISKTQNESQKLIALKQARITLLEEINTWYKTNVFSSPIDGKLQYNIPINENQFITQGTELFTITPESKQQIFCNMIVPMGGMGKVILDQRVIIRLEQYPDEEYGVLYGKVEEISPSPNKEKNYSIKVSLDNGLNTSYNKEISFKPNMEGNADIVTKDKSFLHRVFEQLLKLIKR